MIDDFAYGEKKIHREWHMVEPPVGQMDFTVRPMGDFQYNVPLNQVPGQDGPPADHPVVAAIMVREMAPDNFDELRKKAIAIVPCDEGCMTIRYYLNNK